MEASLAEPQAMSTVPCSSGAVLGDAAPLRPHAAAPPRLPRRDARPELRRRHLWELNDYAMQCTISPHRHDMQTILLAPSVWLAPPGLVPPMMSCPTFREIDSDEGSEEVL